MYLSSYHSSSGMVGQQMQLFACQCKRVYLVVEVILVFMDRPTHKISLENIMLGAINRG